MSKEQTPIRKLIDEHIEPAWEGAYNADKEALEKDIQEIINAKVLEALESREHINCGKDGVKTICPACRNVLWTTKQK